MIHLNNLRLRDWRLCWVLAHDPTERAMARDPNPPGWWQHLWWMLAWRFSLAGVAWVVRFHHRPVGLVRASATGRKNELEVHINLLPEARGHGIGPAVLRHIAYHASVNIGVRVVAYVKPANTASIRAFEKAGFMATDTAGENGGTLVRMVYCEHMVLGLAA